MIYHAAQAGVFNLKDAVLESLVGAKRAGIKSILIGRCGYNHYVFCARVVGMAAGINFFTWLLINLCPQTLGIKMLMNTGRYHLF